MWVCVAAGGAVFLENPGTSYMFETKYFKQFVRNMKRAGRSVPRSCTIALNACFTLISVANAEVWKVAFWMRHWGHENPKRTFVVSDRRLALGLDKGKLPKARSAYPTAIRYKDKHGRQRYQGHRENLKRSGHLV